MTRLEISGLSTGYFRQRPCLRDVNLNVDQGELLCLLGPNGAGKTTLLLALAGLIPTFGGTVRIDGHQVRSGHPRSSVSSGLVLVPDDRALFRRLSTEQNLRLAVRERGSRTVGVEQVLEYFPALRKRLKIDAGRLSGGEQQMLAIGRAIVQRPKVLLIDELSMGLAPVIVEEILPVLRRLAETDGTAVILVEQHVHVALRVADRAAVLVHGELVLEDSARTLLDHPDRVERAYLGQGLAASGRSAPGG
ncbi:ABC transporter ATP-binding protein [Gordonia rhizosphera]|uniref:Putative ABC transporter ATP-binding protein n=1 Tax=Gordonia rhizosphera NBRC 16068 TaxID=1108045 RepID=K6V5D3_9ACTN|nr:ATP-binding cassette domain-containing protein [Gordonia rhizosphera]GAB91423.1 putative ABC transporter ATP-binding protein [Gordonia rhizosphera NBRC 16068]